jgi:hypothetical protein
MIHPTRVMTKRLSCRDDFPAPEQEIRPYDVIPGKEEGDTRQLTPCRSRPLGAAAAPERSGA